MKVTIDLEELKQLAQDGKDIFLRADGEQALLKLLDAEDTIEEALAEARRLLEAEALKINPNFSTLRADHLTIHYRAHGPKFRLDERVVENLPAGLCSSRTAYSVNSEAVERFMREQGCLPEGISEIPRTRQIVISRKNSDHDEL